LELGGGSISFVGRVAARGEVVHRDVACSSNAENTDELEVRKEIFRLDGTLFSGI
jgi:hypothetical protein